MSTHNICFYGEIYKKNYFRLLRHLEKIGVYRTTFKIGARKEFAPCVLPFLSRPRWLSWMRRPRSATFLCGD